MRNNRGGKNSSGPAKKQKPGRGGRNNNKEQNKEPQNRPRGASASKTTVKEKWQSYVAHHKSVFSDSLKRLLQTPIPTLMTIGVIAIALALPAGFFVLLKNAQTLSRDWDGNAQISLFLHKHVRENDARVLQATLLKRNDVARTQYISKEQALEEFTALSGFGDVLDGLDENPLPAVIVIYPKSRDVERAEALRVNLAKMPAVELAQLDAEWVRKLHSIIRLGERLVTALGLGLALAVLLVMVNTIRLAIENRRDEIVIVKLVGATDAFVRRPFLYMGFWFGLGGGLAATFLVEVAMLWMDNPVMELSKLYESEYVIAGLGVSNSFFLVVFSACVGLLGAWVAVGRHLKQIEPT